MLFNTVLLKSPSRPHTEPMSRQNPGHLSRRVTEEGPSLAQTLSHRERRTIFLYIIMQKEGSGKEEMVNVQKIEML